MSGREVKVVVGSLVIDDIPEYCDIGSPELIINAFTVAPRGFDK